MLRSFAAGSLMGARFGSGPPRVLALHGWARTHLDFTAVLAPNGADPLDAVALDLPGFGATPAPPEAWGSPEYAQTVSAVLAEMASPVVVLGHSFGGRVAVHLAAARPDAVGALVLSGVPLLHPAGPKRRPAAAFRAGRLLHRLGMLPDSRMEALRRRYGSSDYRAAEGVMRQVLVKVVNEEYDEALQAIGCPVTLVWGDDDDVAPVAMARLLEERLSDARLVEVAGAGHLTPLTAPGALRDAVTRALRSGGNG